MNIIDLFQDYSIPYYTEGYKYCREGWVNVDCPFCTGNPGPHLGFELDSNHFNCWRCGWHPVPLTISKLLNISEAETRQLLKKYNGFATKAPEAKVKIKQKELQYPSGTASITAIHKRYLESRNFDPLEIERKWGILGTGPVSVLDGLNYRFRVIIPFFWHNSVVSFDSRDITGKHAAKYMACPGNREFRPHKSILYGIQHDWGETGICVEGPTDAWRFGTKSFAVSGIKYTPEQVREIAKAFKRVAVCFDGGELQATAQANKLVDDLRFRGVDAWRVDIVGDPGSMDQKEANYLVKQLINK